MVVVIILFTKVATFHNIPPFNDGAGLGWVGPCVMVKCPKSVLWRPQGSDIGDRHNRIELQSILYTSYTDWPCIEPPGQSRHGWVSIGLDFPSESLPKIVG